MKNKNALNYFYLITGILFFFLLSLGQLQRVQLSPSIAIYLHDLLVVLGLMVGLWEKKQTILPFLSRSLQLSNLLEFLFGGWVMIGLFLAAINGSHALVGLLYLTRLLCYVVFTWSLLSASFWQLLPTKIAEVSLKYWAYIISGLAILGLGFIQYLLLPDTRFLGVLGWDNHYYRLLSTQLDPAFTGMILVLTLLSLFQIKISGLNAKEFSETHLMPSWIKWGVYLLITLGIALTFSRASYLALAAGILTYSVRCWLRTKKLPLEMLLIVLLICLLPILPRKGGEGVNLARTSTVTARLTASNSSVVALKPAQWLLGRGLFVPEKIESTRTERPDHALLPDNLLVLLITNLGFIGCGLLLLLGLKHRNWWMTQSPVILSATAAVLVHAQFNQTLFQPFVFLFLVGNVVTGKLERPQCSLKRS